MTTTITATNEYLLIAAASKIGLPVQKTLTDPENNYGFCITLQIGKAKLELFTNDAGSVFVGANISAT